MRTTTTIFIASLAFLAGLAVLPTVSVVSDLVTPEWNHRCLRGSQVCVGMKAEQALKPYPTEGSTGGLIGVSCGFSEPGAGAEENANLASIFEHGCGGKKYVASFSDGRHLVNLWVDQGVIVQIDYGPRHVIDL